MKYKDKKKLGICKNCQDEALPDRTLCRKHMDIAIASRKSAYAIKKSKGLCMKCTSTPAVSGMSLCQMHLNRATSALAARNNKLKLETFNAYGGPHCACPKCPQRELTMLSMLTIDHIAGGGNKHRKEICQDRGGISFYRWLKRNGYPSGYQVLCWNCNLSKRYDICEHMR